MTAVRGDIQLIEVVGIAAIVFAAGVGYRNKQDKKEGYVWAKDKIEQGASREYLDWYSRRKNKHYKLGVAEAAKSIKAIWQALPQSNYDQYFDIATTQIAIIAYGHVTIHFQGTDDVLDVLCNGRLKHFTVAPQLVGVPFKLKASKNISSVYVLTANNVNKWEELK